MANNKIVYRNGRKFTKKPSHGPVITFWAVLAASVGLSILNFHTVGIGYALGAVGWSFAASLISRLWFRPQLKEILPPPKEQPQITTTGDDEIDRLLQVGESYVAGIHSVALTVKDLAIKSQLEGIESTCKSIFEQVGKRRNKLSEVKQFMDYYLPTTLKLIHSYQKLEQQGVSGENTNTLRKSIHAALPTIRQAFKNQLDNLYQDEMIDITTDIEVLQGIMQKNGLLDEDDISKI